MRVWHRSSSRGVETDAPALQYDPAATELLFLIAVNETYSAVLKLVLRRCHTSHRVPTFGSL